MQSKYLSLLLLACLGETAPQAAKRGSGCGMPPPKSSSSSAPSSISSAAPIASSSAAPNTTVPTGSNNMSVGDFIKVLEKVAPNSTSCDPSTLKKPEFASQCATATQAAVPFMNSFQQYNLTTSNEKAAVVALTAYESGDFRFDLHEFPSPLPGQCTRAVMMPANVLLYAKSLPHLPANLSSLGSATDASSLSNETLTDMCSYITSDPNLDFGAAAWYLRSQCSPTVQSALKTGGETGWESYMKDCVKVDVSAEPDRKTSYEAAVAALPK